MGRIIALSSRNNANNGRGGVTWPAGGVNIGAIKEPRRCFTPRDRPIDHPLSKHSADRIQRGKNLLPLPFLSLLVFVDDAWRGPRGTIGL